MILCGFVVVGALGAVVSRRVVGLSGACVSVTGSRHEVPESISVSGYGFPVWSVHALQSVPAAYLDAPPHARGQAVVG